MVDSISAPVRSLRGTCRPRGAGLFLCSLALLGLLFGLLLLPPAGVALAWSDDPTENTAICTATGDQSSPQIVSDGSGGYIITWTDYRNGSSSDIYAQRVDSSGTAQWTANGVAVCTATSSQYSPQVVSDGSGGAIITWYDYRSGSNYDIYAQRVNSSGFVQWTPDGVAVCTATSSQYSPQVVSDGSGGAIITWYDYRSGSNYDIYAQRVNSSGSVQWTPDGVAVCTATGEQSSPQIVSDGSGGAIVTWNDYRDSDWEDDIYAQRVDSSGAVRWAENGVAICTIGGGDEMMMGGRQTRVTSDGSGGAIITWNDYRDSDWEGDIYAQRVDSSGTV